MKTHSVSTLPYTRMTTSRVLKHAAVCLSSIGCALATQAMETYRIVSSGENAPESLVRVVTGKAVSTGNVAVSALQGPCKQEAKIKTSFVVQTDEQVARGDLFFKVATPNHPDGFSLRRATPDEIRMYAECRWR